MREGLARLVREPPVFSRVLFPGRGVRGYQAGPLEAIARAVVERAAGRDDGPGEFAVVFSRQAGKDEMLAQLLAYLLVRFSLRGGSVVVALPTLRPQGAIARD